MRTCSRGILPAARFGNAGAAHQHQHGVGKVVAHHEVQIPPAGQDDGRRGQEQQPEPGQVQLFKPEIQREQQDAEGEDQAEPVRLAQHGAHAQPRVGKGPGQTDEKKYQKRFFHLQHLAHFDHQTGQQKQQHGHDAEHLTDRKAVAGAVGQAERELEEQGVEVGIVLSQRVQNEMEADRRALKKGGLGVVLLVDVVDVVPNVHEAAAGLGPVEVEQRRAQKPMITAQWNRSNFTSASRSTTSTSPNRARLHHRLTSGKNTALPRAARPSTTSASADTA